MANDTIFQNWIFKDYILPFLLVFVLVFAVLEKTKLLGEGKKQLNAILAFVVGLIVVGVMYPKEVIGNMILFLTVSLVVVFVFLLLYGFVIGDKDGFKIGGPIKWILIIILVIAVIVAVLWATGADSGVIDLLFNQSWSNTFWTNLIFVVVFVGVVAWVLKSAK